MITVGVVTTMGESGLRVLDRGDAAGPDSRGLWQQRDNGAWGSLADRMDPSISSTNGFKALIAVPGYRDLARDPGLLTSLPVNGSAVSGADCPDVQPASVAAGTTGGKAISGK